MIKNKYQKLILICGLIVGASVASADCPLPWDESQTVSEGTEVWAYLNPMGDYNTKCKKQKRICRNGALLGNYQFKECAFKSGCDSEFGFLPEGTEITAYRSPAGEKDGACEAEVRICSKSQLSGSFSYLGCKPKKNLGDKPSTVHKM